MLGAHVQTVGKVLHEVSGHHITTSASIAGVHSGGVEDTILIYEVRRLNQSGEVEKLDKRVRRFANQIHNINKDMIILLI